MINLKNIFLIGLLAGGSISAMAYTLPAGTKDGSVINVSVNNIRRSADATTLTTDMTFDLSRVNLKSNAELVVTPIYVNGLDTVKMEPITVAGRNRWYWLDRNNLLEGKQVYKGWGKDKLAAVNVQRTTPYLPWMEVAELELISQDMGCANCLKGAPVPSSPLAQTDFVPRYFTPEFLYVTPVAEAVKMREISARAYIDFPVNRTEIYPDYRRNPEELAKIRATIDSVRTDKDINITSLHISGTASPEGGYQNNVRLAKGRTESLKDYVQGLYKFPAGLITTSFEPVDWQGLAEFLQMVVGLSDNPKDLIRQDQFQNINYDPATIREILPNAITILGIVNGDLEPFARNQKIKTTYPKEYAWLLENVYPALRHSDYRIQFEIKTYTEVSEIIEVMESRPQNLSLAELFVAANSQPEGSELYNKAFELAVKMYPEDETANLNAAVAAMQRGDMLTAQRYLSRVKTPTPESDYASAMFLLLEGNQEKAMEILSSLAKSSNLLVAGKASKALAGLEEVAKANASNFRILE